MPNPLKPILRLGCLSASLFITTVSAQPFGHCPTKAYLIQTPGSVPITYGVDLSIGSYSVLSPDMGTTKVNGVGFSFHDNYMYGWDYGTQTLAQIGNDYQTTPLNVSGLIGKSFYVGDVSILDNAWYGYRPNKGLYRIDLTDPTAALVMTQIATSNDMGKPSITDFAFHPGDGLIYAVDNNGYLMSISPDTGEKIVFTQVLSEAELGFNFTFGAQYFDVKGQLYLSNNGNGHIYRVTLDGTNSHAVFFSYGPSSNSNDGARCAYAEIEIGDSIDFGDAPDSYGSTINSSGARHGITDLHLGSLVDAETDAYAHPLSDDISDSSDDDDGVSFPTGFEIGEGSIVTVNVTGENGFLNAWADWDLDGEFDEDEKIISQLAMANGTTNLAVDVPSWAIPGDTWMRFRISSLEDIGPTGGVSDGEVEDYPIAVTENGVSMTYYPSATSYTTFAYEDRYPNLGDFDMNDVLMNVRIVEYVKDGNVIRIKIEGKLAALGASLSNGFAFQLPGVPTSAIKGDSIALTVNNVGATHTVLESNQTNAVLIVSNDLWSMTQAGEGGCNYFRTEEGCGTSHRPDWNMIIPFATPISTGSMTALPYDPFIFAKPHAYHGGTVDAITGIHPGRKYEVHLKNKAPTDTFSTALFGIADDASNFGLSYFFQNISGLPWALEIPDDWKHPKEFVSILQAYPLFGGFASDSTGATNPNWYLEENANQSYLFTD